MTALGVWAAVVGLFLGAVIPFWNSEAGTASAEAALASRIRPNFRGAEAELLKAIESDSYSARPWRMLARLYLMTWQEDGARAESNEWRKVPITLLKAVSWPRSPNVWGLHAERADVMRQILDRVGPSLKETERLQYLANIVEATRTASRLHPTNATLRAKLAFASANVSMFADAVSEAKQALRLDEILEPHPDKQLAAPLREQLRRQLPDWIRKAEAMPDELRH
jgi:hypothetical protein